MTPLSSCQGAISVRCTWVRVGQAQRPNAAVPRPCKPGAAAVLHKSLVVQAGNHVAATAALAAATPTSAAQLLQPALAFSTATYIMVPVYISLAFYPRSKLTSTIIDSAVLPLAYGAAYAVLAWQAWQSGAVSLVVDAVCMSQPLPDATSLASIFEDQTLAALAWLHLLLLDFLTARAVLMDGLRQLVPTWHSVLLCFMVGPLGLLSHLITRFTMHRMRHDSPATASSSMWHD